MISSDSTLALSRISKSITEVDYFFSCLLSQVDNISNDKIVAHIDSKDIETIKKHIDSFSDLNLLLNGIIDTKLNESVKSK